MKCDFDTVVVGAGAVGISSALHCAKKGDKVLLIERNSSFGEENSSRNSEVIHAGIYYEKNSLKHLLCVEGKEMLFSYLEKKNIPHNICGKYIIAKKDQYENLKNLYQKGLDNSVNDLEFISNSDGIKQLDELDMDFAIWSPRTAVFDSHSYMVSMIADFESMGGLMVFNTQLVDCKKDKDNLKISTLFNNEITEVTCKNLINCAGLMASKVASKLPINQSKIPKITLAKGNYFSYSGKNNFTSLIYPVPDKYSLGIHLTVDQNNQIRFGPDVEFVNQISFNVSNDLKEKFYKSFVKFWPNMNFDKLQPSYAGIRPKVLDKSGNNSDFIIDMNNLGQNKIINLFGIESPGLTSSLAIGNKIAINL